MSATARVKRLEVCRAVARCRQDWLRVSGPGRPQEERSGVRAFRRLRSVLARRAVPPGSSFAGSAGSPGSWPCQPAHLTPAHSDSLRCPAQPQPKQAGHASEPTGRRCREISVRPASGPAALGAQSAHAGAAPGTQGTQAAGEAGAPSCGSPRPVRAISRELGVNSPRMEARGVLAAEAPLSPARRN